MSAVYIKLTKHSDGGAETGPGEAVTEKGGGAEMGPVLKIH